jgi:hypothetical protein
MGKQPCVIVQLHMSRCQNQFGVLPCTAVGTGNQKCFRTRSSCKSPVDYIETDLWTINLATTRVTGFQNIDESPVFPILTSVDTAPTILTPGKGLGTRGSVKIKAEDFPWTDVYTDPYRTERTGAAASPGDVGTFWGKFLARNRYHENRRVTVYTGFLDDGNVYNAANFQTRTYFITNISGPGSSGSVTIEAKDPLKFADNDKTQFPLAYRFSLTADATAVQTTLTVLDGLGELTTAGPILTASQPYICVDTEVMKVTGISPAPPAVSTGTPVTYTLTVVRGPGATAIPSYYNAGTNVGATHKTGATIVAAYEWSSVSATAIIRQLLLATGISSTYIEALAIWDADFASAGIASYLFTNLLIRPEGVKNLLDELCNHNILLWWDERAQLIKCRALVFRSALNAIAFNETSNLAEGTQNIVENAKERVSQAWVAWNVINPTYNLKLTTSYEVIDISADLSLETAAKYDQRKVSILYSRWLETNAALAPQIASRQLQRFQDSYHVFTFEVDPKDSQYWTGDNVRIDSSLYQDEFGNNRRVNYLITQADEMVTAEGIRYKFTCVEQTTYSGLTANWTPVPGVVIPAGLPVEGVTMPVDYDTAPVDIKESYVFWGYASGQFLDGQNSYTWA